MRHIFGIISSLITAILIIIIAQMIQEGLYPKPLSLPVSGKDALSTWYNNLPNQAFIIIAISHGLAAFASGLISSLVVGSSRMTSGIITITIVFVYVMIYLFTYFFPTWFVITDTVITAVAGFSGVLIGSARYV